MVDGGGGVEVEMSVADSDRKFETTVHTMERKREIISLVIFFSKYKLLQQT